MAKNIRFHKIGGPEVLQLIEEDVPDPKANEVQVDIKAAGLNRAEYMYIAGQYLVQPKFPSLVGIEGAGIVFAIGSDVRDISIGDEVCIMPTFSFTDYGVIGERMNIPAASIQPKPEFMSFNEAAAAFIAYLTAWGGLVHSAGLKQNDGQVVLIPAASSSVGIAAIQLANAYGATTIATTRKYDKVEQLKRQNPTHIIVTEEEDLVPRVMEITHGKGFNIAFDPVGGRFIETMAAAAAYEAIMIEYGLLSMEETPIPFLATATKALSYKGFHVILDIITKLERFQKALDHLLPCFEDGTYKPVIDKIFSLEETDKAYAYMESNTQFGKIVVEVS